jgi:dTDP-4-amino-4,6-dideoxygalactose transaminase
MVTVFQKLKDVLMRNYRGLWLDSGSITWRECATITASLLVDRDIVSGKAIKKYEDEFGKYLGVKHAFSFGAGRMAFYAILKAMGVQEGDEVILPGYTCVVVPDAVIYCGARPVYVDIDRNTLNIDTSKIEEKISPHTRILYAQHTFGSFCNMKELMAIAEKHHLMVVEDCAHALGAEYDGRKVGTFGHAAYFTTEQSKIMSTGMGGMAVTNDDEIAAKIREIQVNSDHPDKQLVKKIALQIVLYKLIFHPSMYPLHKYFLAAMSKLDLHVESTTKEEMEGIRPDNYPVRLSNMQAKVGLSQLKGLQKNIEHRYQIAKFYEHWLKTQGYEVPTDDDDLYKPSYIRYWFLTADKEGLKRYFYRHNVQLGEWFECPVHPKGTALNNVFYEEGSCSNSEYVIDHNVNLPTHLRVRENDVARILQLLARYDADLVAD